MATIFTGALVISAFRWTPQRIVERTLTKGRASQRKPVE